MTNEYYPSNFVDRRAPPPDNSAIVLLLDRQHDAIEKIQHEVAVISATLKAHIDAEAKTFEAAIERAVKLAISEAFVDGDAISHRKEHQVALADKEEKDKMWKKLGMNVISGLAMIVIPWIGVIVWQAFLQGPTK